MKIEYTKEMEIQDKLWDKEQEDLEQMNKLQWQIIADFLFTNGINVPSK